MSSVGESKQTMMNQALKHANGKRLRPHHFVEASLAKNDLQHTSHQIRVLHLLHLLGQLRIRRQRWRRRGQRLQLHFSRRLLHQLHQLHHHRHDLLPSGTAHLLMDRLRLHRGGERHRLGHPAPLQRPQIQNELLHQAFGRS